MGWLKYVVPDDWAKIFGIDTPLLEIFVRITIVYLFLVLLLRVALKRESGGLSVRDVLILVLIADAVQNGMAGTYTSVTDALLIGGTLVFWDYVLSWASYRWPAVNRLLEPPPRELIREGRVLRENLAREFMRYDDLIGQLRHQGVERPGEVRLAVIESDGRVSVLPRDEDHHQPSPEPPLR